MHSEEACEDCALVLDVVGLAFGSAMGSADSAAARGGGALVIVRVVGLAFGPGMDSADSAAAHEDCALDVVRLAFGSAMDSADSEAARDGGGALVVAGECATEHALTLRKGSAIILVYEINTWVYLEIVLVACQQFRFM